MTLLQISQDYEASAKLLQDRMRLLRRQLTQTQDPEEAWQLRRRMAQLTPLLTQMNELAQLTAHYYDRGYYRNERYTMQTHQGASAKRSPTAAHAIDYGQ